MDIKLHKSVKIIALITFILSSILLVLRFEATSGLKVNEYKVMNSNISLYHGYKIVHFSDIHYKSTINYNELEKVVAKINFINPDIVVFTGDIFDSKINYSEKDLQDLIKLFSNIKASYKKYAVMGDNDSKENFNKVIGNSGFINLNDNFELIYDKKDIPILIAGITGHENINSKLLPVNDYLLDNEETKIYKILLTHEPDNIKYTSNFDLVLAGHSLNGQLRLPFIGGIIRYEGAKNYYEAYYKVNNTDLYISGGLGTTNVNLRLLNKPSINFYRIVNH